MSGGNMISLTYWQGGSRYKATFNSVKDGVDFLIKPAVHDEFHRVKILRKKIEVVTYYELVRNSKDKLVRAFNDVVLGADSIESSRVTYLKSDELIAHLKEKEAQKEAQELLERKEIGDMIREEEKAKKAIWIDSRTMREIDEDERHFNY